MNQVPSPAEGIPQSDALKEVTLESLGDVMSRDPEGFSRQDRNQIVAAFRAQRVRWQQAEAEGKSPKPKGQKISLSSVSNAKAEDLDL